MTGLLRGRKALVTGAAKGIGLAAAERFTAEGARVALLDVDRAAVEEAGARLDGAVALAADVGDEASVAAATLEAERQLGGLDVVVANAGVELAGRDDRADRLDLEVWEQTLRINLTGAFLTCKHGVRALLRAGGGSVVCTASPTGLYGCAPGLDAYSTSKAGVYGLIRVLASDYAAENIRVNGVVPGYTATPMNRWVDEAEHVRLLTTIPMGRIGRPEEVAAVMAFLASDQASYTTGAVWACDGGMTAI